MVARELLAVEGGEGDHVGLLAVVGDEREHLVVAEHLGILSSSTVSCSAPTVLYRADAMATVSCVASTWRAAFGPVDSMGAGAGTQLAARLPCGPCRSRGWC